MNQPVRAQPRKVLFGARNRERLLQGVRIFSRTVCVTYGPAGRVAMLNRASGLLATKDGVTVAREINLRDPVANMACQTLKQACIQVNDEAGDGTTSAACIAAAILEEGCKLTVSGYNPILLARGIRKAADQVVNAMLDAAKPITTQDELVKVAFIASNGDTEVAEQLAEAVMAVGKNGTVSIEDGKGVETTLVFKEGLEIDRGALSMHFLGAETERVLEGPLVACIAATLRTTEDVLDLLGVASQFYPRPLLVFAEGIEGDALKTMVMNDTNADVDFECVGVMAPGFHDRKVDYLGDLAALSGADLIDPRQGGQWKTWDLEWFGALQEATIAHKRSTLVGYPECREIIGERIEWIRATAQHGTSDYDKDRVNERIAGLEGGLCIMQIGAYTEAALKEKRARVEDALGAVQGALEEGILPGGGIAYLIGHQALAECPYTEPEMVIGWGILREALCFPLAVLAQNAGYEGSSVLAQVLEARKGEPLSWIGWDALANEIRDFGADNSVIDPTRVAIAVIDAAVSAASTLLTSEVSISRIRS